MKKKLIVSVLPLTLLVICMFFITTILTFAETIPDTPAQAKFTPLVGIPGLTDAGGLSGSTPLPVYINRIYMLLIVIGALIGVVKIVFAGVKYSLSDIITDKHDAKEDIMGVFLGLVLLLIPFIVLNTIYPDLTNLNILQPGSGKMPDNGSSGSIQTTGALDDQYELPRGQKKISCNNDRTDCAKLCERLNGVAARPADPSIQSIWTCIYTPRT